MGRTIIEKAEPRTSGVEEGWSSGVAATFQKIAAMRPNATAMVQQGQMAWSYADLDGCSDQFAHNLNRLGVQPGDRVAILAARSPETIAAILGVVKAGAVYVPLDPAYPPAQLAHMAQDASPVLLIATADHYQSVPAFSGAAVAPLASMLEASAEACAPWPTFRAGPEHPLYIMYTSGSAGRPKGVVVPHRAVMRLVVDQDFCDLSEEDIVLHLSPLAFDASTFEVWGALLNGGALAILASDRPSLAEIGATIADTAVTTAWLTAGLFHLMVDHSIDALRPLQQLLAGGDVLSLTHVKRMLQEVPTCRIINGYGPTENTTFTCCHTFSEADLTLDKAPIGKPIRGTQVFVLDDAGLPVQDGEIGQLAAAGEGVALGYNNLPELTAERFVVLPAMERQVYLSGDLVRRRADGVLDFFGRSDGQVKISGRRVELGEIETALRNDAEIADCAVIAVEHRGGGKRLFAFVTRREVSPESSEWTAALLSRLGERLPKHMIPAGVTSVASLPLTLNGKIDRASLARLRVDSQVARTQEGKDVVRHVGHELDNIEAVLTRIWEGVLGAPVSELKQSFFDLGGRSLQLIQAHAESQRDLGRQFPLDAMFEHSTIESLAAFLHGAEPARSGAGTASDRAVRAHSAAKRARLARARG